MLLVLCLGFFMILLDTTIVNIAIPSILDGLNTSLEQILWVLNAYILVYAVLLITAGRLGDLYGQRNLFVIGLALFTASSAACGLSQSVQELIFARISQGVGGALLAPQTLAMITYIFPAEKRGAAFGVWGAVAGAAAVAGPTLGGVIVSSVGWRWIFYVNVPIGLLAVVLGLIVLPDVRFGRHHSLDMVGVLLASAGLFGVVFGLITGQSQDWGSVVGSITIGEVIAAGILLLAVFVVWEHFEPEPLVAHNLFRNRNFALMTWVSAALSFGMLGLFLPLTIYFQSALGMSALAAGLTILPMPVVSALVAPWAGRLADQLGGKYILMVGLSLFALGLGLVDWVAAPNSTWSTFTLPLMLAGVGMGCTFAPLSTVAMRNITPQIAGSAAGVLNAIRQVGAVFGSAVVGAVLQNRLAASLRTQASTYSHQLSPRLRPDFVAAFAHVSKSGFKVGRGQSGGAGLPPGMPAQLADQLNRLAHEVFLHGYVAAMRPTLIVSVAVVAVAAVSCAAIKRRAPQAPNALGPTVTAAAGAEHR